MPFSVMVTDPSGKTYIWSDDDMDGIIYKKGIAPGTYQVIMESLTDSKYADFTVSTASRSVEVKEEIAYSKVDVENEVKQETEINAAEEDTKKNETVVESTLEDTQTWVDSNVVGAVYSEISKSSIPDPATLGMSGQSVGMDQMAAAMSQTVRVLAAAGSQPGWLEYAGQRTGRRRSPPQNPRIRLRNPARPRIPRRRLQRITHRSLDWRKPQSLSRLSCRFRNISPEACRFTYS